MREQSIPSRADGVVDTAGVEAHCSQRCASLV